MPTFVVLMVVAVALHGYLPLHCAAKNNAGLDVVEALLQAHMHAAAVTNTVWDSTVWGAQ